MFISSDYEESFIELNRDLLESLEYELKYWRGEAELEQEDYVPKTILSNLDIDMFAEGISIDGLVKGTYTFSLEAKKQGAYYFYGSSTQELNFGNNSIKIELKKLPSTSTTSSSEDGTFSIDFYTDTELATNNKPLLKLYYYNEDYYTKFSNNDYPSGVSYLDFLRAFNTDAPENENGIISNQHLMTFDLEGTSVMEKPENFPEEIDFLSVDEVMKYSIDPESEPVELSPGLYFAILSVIDPNADNNKIILFSQQIRIAGGLPTSCSFYYSLND